MLPAWLIVSVRVLVLSAWLILPVHCRHGGFYLCARTCFNMQSTQLDEWLPPMQARAMGTYAAHCMAGVQDQVGCCWVAAAAAPAFAHCLLAALRHTHVAWWQSAGVPLCCSCAHPVAS